MKKSNDSSNSGFTSPLVLMVAVSMLLHVGACARKPTPPDRPPVLSPGQWQRMLEERSAHWDKYQAALRLRGEGSRGNFSFRSIAFAALPDQFRLEAFTPLGQGVALFTVDGSSTQLWIPSEQVVYTAQRPDPLLRRMLGISFPFETLPYILTASLPPDHIAGLDFQDTPSGWLATKVTEPEKIVYTYAFRSQPLSLEGVKVRQGLWRYEISYDPPVELSATTLPQRMTLSGIDWVMELAVEQLDTSQGFSQDVFRPRLPAGVRAVDLAGQGP